MKMPTFTLFVLMVAIPAVSHGAVILTTLDPPLYMTWGATGGTRYYPIDFNSDGIDDCEMFNHQGAMALQCTTDSEVACGIIFGGLNVGGYAQTIHEGETIGSYVMGYNYDWTPGYGTLISVNGITSPPTILGKWGSNRDYLGVRFKIEGEWHYGWVRVHLPATEPLGYIEAFAYETNPNTPILAGAIPEPSAFILVPLSILLLSKRKRT